MLGCLSRTSQGALPSPNSLLYHDILHLPGPFKSCRTARLGFACTGELGWVPRGVCVHTHLLYPSELALTISGTTCGSAAKQVPAAFAMRYPGKLVQHLRKAEASTSPPPQHPLDHGLMFNMGECRVT